MNPLVLLGAVPSWVWAAALAASVAHGCVVTGQRDSSKLAHAELKTAVAEQKAEASSTLAAAGARVIELERNLAQSRAEQEIRSAQDQKTIDAGRSKLLAMSRAGGGAGLRDPNSKAGGRGCSCGADSEAPAAAGLRDPNAAETTGLFSEPMERLLLRTIDEAEAVNLAYTDCRAALLGSGND